MIDDSKTNEETTKAKRPPNETASPVASASTIQTNPQKNTTENTQNSRRQKRSLIIRLVRIIRKHRREFPKWTDIAIVILTGGIVFLAYMQHLDLTDAGLQTDKIICADERIAKAIEGTLAEAQSTLDATIKQAQQEQRAWINITFTDFHWAENDPLKARMHLINSGRTPARILRGHAIVEKVSRGEFPHFSERYPGNDFGTGLLTPNLMVDQWAFQSMSAKKVLWKASAIDVAEINRGDAYVAVHGTAIYEDVYGTAHWSKFCEYASGNMPAVQDFVKPCTNYNDADR